VMQLQNAQLQRQLKEALSNKNLSPGLAVSSNLIPKKDSEEEVKDKPSKNKKK